MNKNKRSLLGLAAAVISAPLLVSSAWGSACVNAAVSVYTAAGFSCTVDGLTFSDFTVNTTASNGGSVTLGNFNPFSQLIGGVLESGLTLNYSAVAPNASATADVAWTYHVDGVGITDAYLALTGNTSGQGVAAVGETLSNGYTLSLNAPGSTTITFPPINSLGVFKDQIDFVGSEGGFSTTSILTNGFSVGVPLPLAGAGLPGLLAACGGLLLLARRRSAAVAA